MLGYFAKRPVMEWRLPSENAPARGVLDGFLSLQAQIELQQRAEAMAAYRATTDRGAPVKVDAVLAAHLGLRRGD